MIKNEKHHIQAASLTNTIFVCMMIGVFCSALVLVSYYYNTAHAYLDFQEELVHHNESAMIYALSTVDNYPDDTDVEIDVLEGSKKTIVSKKSWGFYKLLTCSSYLKNDTISKTVLIGQNSSNRALALYLTNYDVALKLAGKTHIVGAKKIPRSRFENGHFNGVINQINTSGTISNSDKRLPPIIKPSVIPLEEEMLSIGQIEQGTEVFNAFDQPMKSIDLSEVSVLENISFKGHIVLHVTNDLFIRSSAKLEDVLLVASAKVVFEEGFKGKVQVVSTQSVYLEPQVELQYPSSIYVNNDNESVEIHMAEDVKVLGAVVLNGKTYEGSKLRKLIIDEKALVVGTAYNYGYTQLQGTVIGEMYTDHFFLKTETLDAENLILNGVINHEKLPERFVKIPLFSQEELNTKYDVIKTF